MGGLGEEPLPFPGIGALRSQQQAPLGFHSVAF